MKLWRSSDPSRQFEWVPETVARLFVATVTGAGPQTAAPGKTDWPERYKDFAGPVEQLLREWMAAPDGFNFSWEDDAGFAEILNLVQDRLAEREAPGAIWTIEFRAWSMDVAREMLREATPVGEIPMTIDKAGRLGFECAGTWPQVEQLRTVLLRRGTGFRLPEKPGG